jgi:addiction module HigA family antidote
MRIPYQPVRVTPPGETLADLLEERTMTQTELALLVGQSESDVAEIIGGKQAITPQTALHLEQVFGVSSAYWLTHEAHYQASERDRQSGKGATDA